MAQNRSGTAKHSLELQGFRALFILMVLCGHFVGPFQDTLLNSTWLHFSIHHVVNTFWIGVDLFFTLSGFVVTLLLLRSPPEYWKFMRRRADRLLPAYFIMLIVVGVAALLAPFMGIELRDGFLMGQISAWTLAANIAAAIPGGWLDGGGLNLVPTWSLCVEFQFYLVWPILVWRFRDRGLVAAMLAAACLSLLLRCGLSYSGFNYNTVSSLMFSRIDQFAFGGVAAALAYKGRSIRFAPWMAAGILLPFMAVLVMDPTWHKAARWVHTVGYSVLGVGTSALVLSAYQETLWRPFSQVLSSRPLVMIGDRSYSLYLWHLPFYPVISSSVRAGADGWGRTGVMVAVVCASSLVALLLAEASYRLVEQRAATRRHKVT